MSDEEYRLIRRYGKHLRRRASFTSALIDRARAEGAPTDAVHWYNGRWYTADDITNETTRRALELPPLGTEAG